MKFVHITFRFQYTEDIDKMLENNGIADYTRYSMVQGKDADGKHFGSKVFPGNVTVIQAIVPDDKVKNLLADLETFRKEKPSRYHLRALVLPIEDGIGV